MSRAGVYLAHPRPGSFNHAVFDAVVRELRDRDCEVLAHDLCAEGFAPSLSADETDTVGPAGGARDGAPGTYYMRWTGRVADPSATAPTATAPACMA